MAFATFTRPDDAPVTVNTREVLKFATVPAGGSLAAGTRIAFRNGEHQDVKEPHDTVRARIAEALAPPRG